MTQIAHPHPSFMPADSFAALKADLKIVIARHGNLHNWPFIRGHFVNRLMLLKAGA